MAEAGTLAVGAIRTRHFTYTRRKSRCEVLKVHIVVRAYLRNVGYSVLAQVERAPWSNVYGLARTLLAVSTALTLALNPSWALFRPASGVAGIVNCSIPVSHLSLFCIAPTANLDAARLLGVLLLVIVATGWRPRITGLIHWWVSFSVYASARVIDGGEQTAAVLTLLLIPLTLTDPRRSHWQTLISTSISSKFDAINRLIGRYGYFIVQMQVSYIYLDACLEKLRVSDWLDGTIMYYVFSNKMLGAPHFLQPILTHLTTSPLVVLLAWPALLLEFSLGINLLLNPTLRVTLFWLGVLFHCLIALLIGIPSFATIMIAALLLGTIPVGWDLGRIPTPWSSALAAFFNLSGAPLRNPSRVAESPNS